MEDKELRDAYYKRTNKRIEEFAEEIPFNELFSYIKKEVGIDDLQFELSIKEGRDGKLRPTFCSQDIVDKESKLLNLVFNEMTISSFNSEIYVDTPKDYKDIDYEKDYPLGYWCTVALDWASWGGGTNGKTFLSAYYENNEWVFKLEKDR